MKKKIRIKFIKQKKGSINLMDKGILQELPMKKRGLKQSDEYTKIYKKVIVFLKEREMSEYQYFPNALTLFILGILNKNNK